MINRLQYHYRACSHLDSFNDEHRLLTKTSSLALVITANLPFENEVAHALAASGTDLRMGNAAKQAPDGNSDHGLDICRQLKHTRS